MKITTRAVYQWDEAEQRYRLIEEEAFDYEGPLALCGKPKAPDAPDPTKVAAAQTEQERKAAEYNAALNRINQSGPQGSVSYQITGTDPATGAPIYSQTTSLSPELQSLWGNAVQQYQQPFSYGGIEDLSQKAGNALYDKNTAYLDPQFQQGESQLRQRLANQGIPEGSEAYTNAMRDFNQSKEMAYRQARDTSIAGAGSESDRLLQQAMAMRGIPANELNSMMTMGTPSYQGVSQFTTNPADIAAAMQNQYQGQMNQYNQEMASRNQMIQGLMSMGGMAAMSDERVKENIEHVGALDSGDNLYLFSYKGDSTPHVGVMAQEIEKVDPEAVVTHGGIKHVKYGRVIARALEAM